MVDPGSSRSGRTPAPAVSVAATASCTPLTGSSGATAAKARAPDSAWSWPSMAGSRGFGGSSGQANPFRRHSRGAAPSGVGQGLIQGAGSGPGQVAHRAVYPGGVPVRAGPPVVLVQLDQPVGQPFTDPGGQHAGPGRGVVDRHVPDRAAEAGGEPDGRL